MSGSQVAYQADCIYPPRAGQISVFTTSTSAATVDLRTLGVQQIGSAAAFSGAGTSPVASFVANQDRKGLTGHYIRVTAVTTAAYVSFGPTSASVGSITTASTGANAANNSVPIAAGTYQDFWIPSDPADQSMAAQGPCTWLGYVSTGAGTICIAQASP